MCGIAGFYTSKTIKGRADLHAIGRDMASAMQHRGPDHEGVWQDPDTAVILAHRRLSIIDLSEEGHQPMHSVSERYAMVYNGEIYNFLSLQKELITAGFKFRGRSDTEVVLAGFEHWGINRTLQKMRGMFAFALWDRKEKMLHFVRDPLGKKPLYFGWAGISLVFGSELKSLRAHPDMSRDINRQSLDFYMRYGHVPAPHCIYKNIWSLPAGCRLAINIEKLAPNDDLSAGIEPFWHHLAKLEEAKAQDIRQNKEDIIDEFEDLLGSCVEERLVSDVPIGAFLSGGIDSSTVVALMQKTAAQPVKTYTIGFEETGFNEAAYAKDIAAHLGTDHHELYLSGKDALDAVPKMPEIYDEPFADISAIPTYLLAAFTRKDVTVALSGDGGDEMLGGYNRHIMGPKIQSRMRMMPASLRSLLSRQIKNISSARWDKIGKNKPQFGSHMHKLAGILECRSQGEIYERLISQWHESPVLKTDRAQELHQSSEWQARNLSFAEYMMYRDALSYLPNDILTKVDRASMAVGLEARAPLLDKRIYEYVWRLPQSCKIQGRHGKWLLREILKRHIPKDLYERPKQGFNMPVDNWLRGPLKDWASELLDHKVLTQQGYLDADKIDTLWQAHQKGEGHYEGALWNVLMFQAWYQRWM